MQKANGEAMRIASNVDELRRQIDKGITRDKVSFADPAAAPLGTDDEAGGHPATPYQLALEARTQIGSAVSAGWPRDRIGTAIYILMVALVASCILAVVAWA